MPNWMLCARHCAPAPLRTTPQTPEALIAAAAGRLEREGAPVLRRVVNATGIVLHTNLGHAPLAPEAMAAVTAVAAGYMNLEYDLDSGRRGSRYHGVTGLMCELTGAKAALVVNNNAAAVLLALAALAAPGEAVVSRGELVEIGGSFRVPDVIAQSGARLVEVGTTNKTRAADYDRAIGPDTRVLLKVHPATTASRVSPRLQPAGIWRLWPTPIA
nr:hypothetical protein [Azospirillum oryzae]